MNLLAVNNARGSKRTNTAGYQSHTSSLYTTTRGTHSEDILAPALTVLFVLLPRAQQLAHAHDHPQRRSAKEPRHDPRRTDARTAPRLPQRTAPHDESDVRRAIVATQLTRQSY